MKLFDLHCDTIERMEELHEDMLTDKTQLSLKYLPQIEKWCQTFAVFVPDNYRGEDAIKFYERMRDYLRKMLVKHADIMEQAFNADDIKRITDSKKCAAILSIEGAAALGGKLENIERYAKDGVKMMTLTWNGDNELASGHNHPEMGFTDFGREAVNEGSNKLHCVGKLLYSSTQYQYVPCFTERILSCALAFLTVLSLMPIVLNCSIIRLCGFGLWSDKSLDKTSFAF